MSLPIVVDQNMPDGFVGLAEPGSSIPRVVCRLADGALFKTELTVDDENPITFEGTTITTHVRVDIVPITSPETKATCDSSS